ncbi:unnamed protein product [Chrysoparadoxa australica]
MDAFPRRGFMTTARRPMVAGTDEKTDAKEEAQEEGEEPKVEEGAAEAAAAEEDQVDDCKASAAEEANEALQAEIVQLKERIKASEQKVVYTMAEIENVRSIAKREVDKTRKFAVQSFAKSLLDVADNLSRAIDSVPEELLTSEDEANAPLRTLLEGVVMTEGSLQKAFAGQGLKKFGEVGETFDPHLHDAMFEMPSPDQEPGTIAQVVKAGYLLNDRVVRAAQVGTVKKA